MHSPSPSRCLKFLPILGLLGFLLAGLGTGGFPAATRGAGQAALWADSSGIQDFHLVSAGSGWLLFNNQLYWTADNGDSWAEITPSYPVQATLAAVDFIDLLHGWAVLTYADHTDPAYALARTQDGGRTWQTSRLRLFARGEAGALAKAVWMQWLDDRTGWLVIQQASGLNFSLGTLFRTTDGGRSWTRLTIPIGEKVTFVTPSVGWVAGGAAGDELYRTQDGGRTWQAQRLAASAGNPLRQIVYLPPKFADVQHGLLPVMVRESGSVHIDFYSTQDGGGTWGLENTTDLAGSLGVKGGPALTIFDPDHLVLLVPRTNSIVRKLGHRLYSAGSNADGRSGSIVQLSMVSQQVGWALQMEGDCSPVPDPGAEPGNTPGCLQTAHLLRTGNGGENWAALQLPASSTAAASETSSLPNGYGSTARLLFRSQSANLSGPFIGHGFDVCEIGSLSQMQSWWTSGPYAVVNLYIGGSARACANTALTPYFLAQLHAQGWKFIPTWVGPQAPCTTFHSRMSSNATTAYDQGISQADAALVAAASLGLTDPAKSGTVIYYDLESYNTSDSACRAAVKSFMNGWAREMYAYGDLSGVYGSPCSSALTDFLSSHYTPDAVWIARWNLSSYTSTATVWGGSCITNQDWANHQRIRQYTGDHTENWGGVAMTMDSDVLDGLVAVPYLGPGPVGPPGPPSDPKPADGATLARDYDTFMYWNTNAIFCSLHIWGGGIDLNPSGDCSSYHLGQRPGGSYSWQVTVGNSYGNTTGPVWHFIIRPAGPSGLSASPVSASQINLAWTLSSDEPANIDNYDVYINGQYVASLPKGTASTSVSGLTCNTSYSFFLRSKRQGVQSDGSNTASATTSSCVPGGFGKIGPADGAPAEPTDELLSWGASPGAASYQYCYDTTDDNTCDGSWTSTVTTSASLSGLSAGSTYYWQVQAVNSDGTTSADGGTWWNFTASDTPATVTPSPTPAITSTPTPTPTATNTPIPPVVFFKLAPSNGATHVPTNPTLSWTTSGGAALYLVCLDAVNNNTCDTSWTVTYTTNFSFSRLTSGTTYYWQVQALKPPGVTYADNGSWFSFTASNTPITVTPGPSPTPTRTATAVPTQPTWTPTDTRTPTSTYTPGSPTVTPTPGAGVPGAFNKLTPTDGAAGVPSNVNLSWSPSSGAALYLYCLSTVNDHVCHSSWTVTYSTSAALSGLVPGVTYYWQVQALKPPGVIYADNGNWWSFKLSGSSGPAGPTSTPVPTLPPTATPTPGAGQPGAFNKLNPANGAAGVSANPSLNWSPSSGAVLYLYCVSNVNDQLCHTAWTVTYATSATLSGLAPGMTYYWQVQAVKPPGAAYADNGSWWSFTVH